MAAHAHTHPHSHPHRHMPAAPVKRGSMLAASAPRRLALAGAMAALLWLAVAWALAS